MKNFLFGTLIFTIGLGLGFAAGFLLNFDINCGFDNILKNGVNAGAENFIEMPKKIFGNYFK